jgi:hypothetical protein
MQTRDIASVAADVAAQDHRRFLKSHTPLDGLPWCGDVTYICVGRDPRDVFMSWDHHVDNMDAVNLVTARIEAVGMDGLEQLLAEGPPLRPDDQLDRFWVWVDDDTPVTETLSLHETLHHLTTFWDARDRPNVILLHYDELVRDLEGEMRRVAERLGIEVPAARWAELVEAASFEHMRANADTIAPNTTNKIWHSNEQFFHNGGSGQWRKLLDDDAVERYWKRARELAPADVLAWAHAAREPS